MSTSSCIVSITIQLNPYRLLYCIRRTLSQLSLHSSSFFSEKDNKNLLSKIVRRIKMHSESSQGSFIASTQNHLADKSTILASHAIMSLILLRWLLALIIRQGLSYVYEAETIRTMQPGSSEHNLRYMLGAHTSLTARREYISAFAVHAHAWMHSRRAFCCTQRGRAPAIYRGLSFEIVRGGCVSVCTQCHGN